VRLDEDSARTVANIVVGAAALGAAVVILRTPALRRLAFGLARTALTVTIPAWLSREVHEAWAETARASSGTVPPETGRSGQLL
jgi:hypothetical protein